MNHFQARTDLALEARESVSDADSSLHGVIVKEEYDEEKDIRVTTVDITTKNGAKAMGKPMGRYVTIETPTLSEEDEDYHREISECIARIIHTIIPCKEEMSVLVVGLGNREVTADALGPNVIDNLAINRHVLMEYGKAAYGNKKMHTLSGLEPGVMGKTGMEASEIVKGVVTQIKPDMIIAVDALAARNTKRLNRTIQITDTGIMPGSGVGNHRNALTESNIGIPVIAIGVPTVVDGATIVIDAFERLFEEENKVCNREYMEECRQALPELSNMYVTCKDIDAVIKRVSYTLSEGLNIALSEKS